MCKFFANATFYGATHENKQHKSVFVEPRTGLLTILYSKSAFAVIDTLSAKIVLQEKLTLFTAPTIFFMGLLLYLLYS